MIQGSLFEDNYLVRTLGALSQSADIALTELVANAWDAGASRVEITVPAEYGEALTVSDDGCGMAPDQFHQRWMTLGYDRCKYQGTSADFPPERVEWKRHAFGRNGVGRHGLLCFAPEYEVDSRRDGRGGKYVVRTSAGHQPFVLTSESLFDAEGHGTSLRVKVESNLPSADRIRDVLAARFLHDPRFQLIVNGSSVPLAEHHGLLDHAHLLVTNDITVEAFFVDSTKAARSTKLQGIAFWVGGRLVGVPSWILGTQAVVDGRTTVAKRYTVVVKADTLFEEVLPDWTGFRNSRTVRALYGSVTKYVINIFQQLSKDRIAETTETVLREHRQQIERLNTRARIEVTDFVTKIATEQPMASSDTLSTAVKAIIHLENTRSGTALLEKLAHLSDEDITELDHLLETWTVRDVATVIEEIDNRISVIEALTRLSDDARSDELHTLHPLVTQARWLFGPEFDSPEYASNVSLSTAARQVFKKKISRTTFLNPKKRPDLIVLDDATISLVSTEEFSDDMALSSFKNILLIELKRGHSEILREHVNQANDYVEDLLSSGLIDGAPYIRAFVVGYKIGKGIQTPRKIGDPERGVISVTTYTQLVRTAHKRLFKLRERLTDRYEELTTPELLQRILDEPKQTSFEG